VRNAPILPTNPNEVYQAIYTDAQEPLGFISTLQRALAHHRMVNRDGYGLVVDGLYGPHTAFALRSWMLQHPARQPSLDLLRLTGDASDRVRVADAAAYFSLGLDVENVMPVRGVTPGAVLIERALERGEIRLDLDLERMRAAHLAIPGRTPRYRIARVDLTRARSNEPLIHTPTQTPYRGGSLTVIQAGGAYWEMRLSSEYADAFTSDELRDGSRIEMEITCVYLTNEAALQGTASLILLFGEAY